MLDNLNNFFFVERSLKSAFGRFVHIYLISAAKGHIAT
jgi:hypothetical protein